MFSFPLTFVNRRFVHRGKIVKAVAETDSGNVQVALPNGKMEWTTADALQPIDGSTRNFRVFDLPAAA